MESLLFVAAAMDAHENRGVMTAGIPNAFIKAVIPKPKEGEDRAFMKLTGVLVGIRPPVSISFPYLFDFLDSFATCWTSSGCLSS